MSRPLKLKPHDQVSFESESTVWDVMDDALDGRYVLLVNQMTDLYRIVDIVEGWRGTLEVTEEDAYRGARFDSSDSKESINYILSELNDGRPLHYATLVPLTMDRHWTSEIRGPVIRGDSLSTYAIRRVADWLRANGCRWIVPSDAVIYIHGKHAVFNSLAIRPDRQIATQLPRRIQFGQRLPQQRRRLRIRIPLSTLRKG